MSIFCGEGGSGRMVDRVAIGFESLFKSAVLPSYENVGDAGMDLRACFESDTIENWKKTVTIPPRGRVLIPTGLKMLIPIGYEGQVRSRSGMSLKKGVIVLNAPGTIDCGYRGEVGIILYNASEQYVDIVHGDRIAQLVVAKCSEVVPYNCIVEPNTDRGEGGFGSTGVE